LIIGRYGAKAEDEIYKGKTCIVAAASGSVGRSKDKATVTERWWFSTFELDASKGHFTYEILARINHVSTQHAFVQGWQNEPNFQPLHVNTP